MSLNPLEGSLSPILFKTNTIVKKEEFSDKFLHHMTLAR